MLQFFPLFLHMDGKRVGFIGNSPDIIAKIRLIQKTPAQIELYADAPTPELADFITQHQLTHYPRTFTPQDLGDTDLRDGARPPLAFVYFDAPDAGLIAACQSAGIPHCVIDDLAHSAFITPALVDRAPVTVAIGTEGTSPVLARQIKASIEAQLPQTLGIIAAKAGQLRDKVARHIAPKDRRSFWRRFFDKLDYHSFTTPEAVVSRVDALLQHGTADTETASAPHIWFIGAGPGDPELLTMQARRLLHEADIILHDRLVPQPILELGRREAEIISVGKTAYGASWRQEDINQLLIEKAAAGKMVVRLKSGDCGVFGRLDEETEAVYRAGIGFSVAAGLTSANVAAAEMGVSLTRRGRNASYRILTAHDLNGFAEHDWQEMAKGLSAQNFTAALYMGVRAAPYLSGRLLMYGAPADMAVTISEHVSRPQARHIATTLRHLAQDMAEADVTGPAVIFLGLHPHPALAEMPIVPELKTDQKIDGDYAYASG